MVRSNFAAVTCPITAWRRSLRWSASVLPSMCVTLADEVSAVSPIVNTTLLFVIVFTAMSCRGEEKITRWW